MGYQAENTTICFDVKKNSMNNYHAEKTTIFSKVAICSAMPQTVRCMLSVTGADWLTYCVLTKNKNKN
jgi:hypothetical protein